MKHLEFRKLIDHFEGLLPDEERREVSEHISKCTECAAYTTRLESFYNFVNAERHELADREVTRSLIDIFSAGSDEPVKESVFRKLLSSLVFDDWQLAANERLVYSDTRQLLYAAGGFEIDVRLSFLGDKCRVAGQIFPGCSEGTAEIRSAEAGERTLIDENCEFSFPPVEQGTYELLIRIDDTVISIGDLPMFS